MWRRRTSLQKGIRGRGTERKDKLITETIVPICTFKTNEIKSDGLFIERYRKGWERGNVLFIERDLERDGREEEKREKKDNSLIFP